MADFVKQSSESVLSATVLGSFMYICGGGGQNVRRSSDGINWTSLGQGEKQDITTFDGFVYIARDGTKRTSATSFSAADVAGLATYHSFGIFDGFLYVGGGNVDVINQRDHIGRTADGTFGSWSGVTGGASGLDGSFGKTVRDFQVFNGQLYAVLDKQNSDVKIFRSSNGTTWTEVLAVPRVYNAIGVVGNTMYLFPEAFWTQSASATLFTTTTGNLGEWTDTGLTGIFTSRRASETIDNRLWCGGQGGTVPGFIGGGTTIEEVTFDVAPGIISDWVDFLGFVWAVSGSGTFKGPASSGFVFTPPSFRLPVLQDFDWQPPVTAIQDTPPV